MTGSWVPEWPGKMREASSRRSRLLLRWRRWPGPRADHPSAPHAFGDDHGGGGDLFWRADACVEEISDGAAGSHLGAPLRTVDVGGGHKIALTDCILIWLMQGSLSPTFPCTHVPPYPRTSVPTHLRTSHVPLIHQDGRVATRPYGWTQKTLIKYRYD